MTKNIYTGYFADGSIQTFSTILFIQAIKK